jgi:hypothetical protein
MYLLLKCLNSDQDLEVMQSHNRPIISRLQKLNANGEKLEGVEDKVDGLVDSWRIWSRLLPCLLGANDDDSSSEEESEHEGESSGKDKEAVSGNVLNEARFGLRPNETPSSRGQETYTAQGNILFW